MHKFKRWKNEHRICQDSRHPELSFQTCLLHALNLLTTLIFLWTVYRDYELCLTEILKNSDGKLHKKISNNTGYTAWYLVPLLTEILNHGQHLDILHTCLCVCLSRIYLSVWTCHTHIYIFGRLIDLDSLFLMFHCKTTGLWQNM